MDLSDAYATLVCPSAFVERRSRSTHRFLLYLPTTRDSLDSLSHRLLIEMATFSALLFGRTS
jgi:hypothetical protein